MKKNTIKEIKKKENIIGNKQKGSKIFIKRYHAGDNKETRYEKTIKSYESMDKTGIKTFQRKKKKLKGNMVDIAI